MDKPATKSKNKLLKFAAASFKNISFSPRRDKTAPDVNIANRLKAHHNKGFSGPMIPPEARRKPKNFEAQEPTSPKVSCIGQIKHKKQSKISKKKHLSLPKEFKPASHPRPGETGRTGPTDAVPKLKNKKKSGITKIFGGAGGRKSNASAEHRTKPPLPESAPALSQMRRFASSRDTFANFDWTAAQIAPAEDRGFYSDEEDRGFSDGEDDVIIPFSAPILSAGAGGVSGFDLEPRKEINLWKRRTMAQPKPLRMNMD